MNWSCESAREGPSDFIAPVHVVPIGPRVVKAPTCHKRRFNLFPLLSAFLPNKMPRYYEDASEEEREGDGADDDRSGSGRSAAGRSEPRIEHTYIVLFLLFFYYFCSCGIERLFQSMVSESERALRSQSCCVFLVRDALLIYSTTI